MTKKIEQDGNKALSATKREIAARIRTFRKDQKLTQRKLGEMLGINFQHVSKYERGEFIPTFENQIKFIKHFSVNMNWLLTGDGTMYINQKPVYQVSPAEANQVIRDEDEMIGEIIDILRMNGKLKSAVYEFIQTLKDANRASDRFHQIVEDLLLEKLQ